MGTASDELAAIFRTPGQPRMYARPSSIRGLTRACASVRSLSRTHVSDGGGGTAISALLLTVGADMQNHEETFEQS